MSVGRVMAFLSSEGDPKVSDDVTVVKCLQYGA